MDNEGPSRRRKKSKSKQPVETNIPQPPQPDLEQASGYYRLFDYPFDRKFQMTADMKKVEAVVKDLPVLNPFYPDLTTLEAYDLLEPVRYYLVKVGLHFVFYIHPGVYEMMVREFAYSFKSTNRMVKKSDSESGVVEKYVESWTFQLRGREWELTHENLRQAFAVREESVKFSYCPDDTWSTFWREITGLATCVYLRQRLRFHYGEWYID